MRFGEHTSPRHLPALIACLVIAAVFGLTASSALAKTFTVNKHGDHAPGKCNAADCTLREAVMAATAKPSDDKVELPSSKPYKLKRDPSLPGPDEANGDLDVGVAIGPGNRTKVVHPGSGRATIDPSATGDRAIELVGNLELRRIKLKGGIAEHGEQSGGAINARGALILRDSVVRGNMAPDVGGGIYIHSGVLILDRTRFRGNSAGNGGAFFVGEAANVELTDSTVDDNSAAGSGGAAWIETGLFFGSSRIVRSTFSGNESGGDGGAVYADSPSISSENSTFADNEADGRGGAIYSAPDSDSHLYNVTIARNRSDADDAGAGDFGGGIYADGGSDVVQIRNSLVVKNMHGPSDQIDECYAPAPVGIESLGGNMISSPTGGCDLFDHGEDLVAPNVHIKDLGNYGGPTKTIALKAASPAIDEADGPNPTTTDQRGEVRNDADIGAYER